MPSFVKIRHIVSSFLYINMKDKLFFIRVAFLLCGLRLLLKVLPITHFCRIGRRALKKPLYDYNVFPAYCEKVIRTIDKLGVYLLKKRCMVSALAAFILLNNKRIYSEIHIGIVKNKDEFIGHAWLQAGDTVLIGGDKTLPFYFEILLTR